MSKIKKIKIENFKAIDVFEANFNGCTAIVTAGNNKGKTSLLKGIVDRIRFIRPEVKVKAGETQGKGELELTDGSKFVWDFDNAKKDTLTFITKENIKQNVTVEFGAKFFPKTFDIDKFLQSSPKEQVKQLQVIIGIDFTDIDIRYQTAYNERATNNLSAEKYQVKLTQMMKCDEVKPVDLSQLQAKKQQIKDSLNALYLQNKNANTTARNEWQTKCREIDNELRRIEAEISRVSDIKNKCNEALQTLKNNGYAGNEVSDYISSLILPNKPDIKYPSEPNYISELPNDNELQDIDKRIMQASEINLKAQQYKDYLAYKEETKSATQKAKESDEKVKSIEKERKELIASAKFPKGISITPDGIEVDGLPLDRNQLSTSKLYTTALRIASMNLGEVKTLYFDASFLDRNSLAEIQEWANAEGLQLLIERPDFDGGEIKYELIEQ